MVDYPALLQAERQQEQMFSKILGKIQDYDAEPLDVPVRQLLDLCAQKIQIFEEFINACDQAEQELFNSTS